MHMINGPSNHKIKQNLGSQNISGFLVFVESFPVQKDCEYHWNISHRSLPFSDKLALESTVQTKYLDVFFTKEVKELY